MLSIAQNDYVKNRDDSVKTDLDWKQYVYFLSPAYGSVLINIDTRFPI